MKKKDLFKVIGVLLLTVLVLHSVRVLYGWEIIVSGVSIPLWVSAVLVVFLVYLVREIQKARRSK